MSNKHPRELHSLLKFVQEKSSFWVPAVNILEIGCGHQSIFEQYSLPSPCSVVAIDRESSLIERAKKNFPYTTVDYQCEDLLHFSSDIKFDLIIDSHSLHFNIGNGQIESYLIKVDELLADNGTFMGEVMTYNKGLLFELPYYFDHHEYLLHKMVGDKFIPQRSILTAYLWEQKLLNQFKIEYFYVDQGLCFDLPKLLESKVSLLKFICKKS